MPFWLRGFSNGFTHDGEPALRSSDESLIVSILSLGTFLGALAAAPCADYLGRRLGLILSTAIVFNLGVLLQTIATDQPLFIAGRFFAGFGVGLISAQSKSHLIYNFIGPLSNSVHALILVSWMTMLTLFQYPSINPRLHPNGFVAQSSALTN